MTLKANLVSYIDLVTLEYPHLNPSEIQNDEYIELKHLKELIDCFCLLNIQLIFNALPKVGFVKLFKFTFIHHQAFLKMKGNHILVN